MTALISGEISGWLIVGLVAVNVSLPYLLRGRRLAPQGWTLPYLERMRPHYWIGLTVAGLGLVHAGLAMSAPIRIDSVSLAGVWVGTGGMILAGAQVMVGMQLRSLRGQARTRLRRTHFRLMAALVLLGFVHLVLNGAVARTILGL